MPPQISEDEASDMSASPAPSIKEEKMPFRPQPKVKAKTEEEDKPEIETKEEDEEEDEDDDSEVGDDEFVVEKIMSHFVDEVSGELRFEVKWEGYDKKADRTWEPEENLESAKQILEEYLEPLGGKAKILADYEEKKAENAESKKGKKRSRQSNADDEPNGSAAKRGGRGRGKNGVHPESSTPPAGHEFKPPTGNWEEQIVAIDACEGGEGAVVVYLTWKGGHKTQHPLSQVYKRCPQRMLKFYESHLVFKKNDEA